MSKGCSKSPQLLPLLFALAEAANATEFTLEAVELTLEADLLKIGDKALEDEFMELKIGEQAFMATRPKLIQAGYTTLDSIR